MYPKVLALVVAFVVSSVAPWPVFLAFGWDDVVHVASYYGPLVIVWGFVIAFANRDANRKAEDLRRQRSDADERRAKELRRDAEEIAERVRRDAEHLLHLHERRIATLDDACDELRGLLSRSMTRADGVERWVAALEAVTDPAFVRANRPTGLPPAVQAIDLAAVFRERKERDERAEDAQAAKGGDA